MSKQEVIKQGEGAKVRARGVFQESINALAEFGGFAFLESFVDGLANMNPDRGARKKIFMTDDSKESERRMLKKKIALWIAILSQGGNVADMLEVCQAKVTAASELLKKNQLLAIKSVRSLESSYRSMKLFFDNTEKEKLRNITFMNATIEQLTDLDNPIFIDEVAKELTDRYDRLDLRESYTNLVIPGYLKSNVIIEKWMKICERNKVTLITDFLDLDKKDDVVDMLMSANLAGGDTYRSSILLCCNWGIGRKRYAELGETEDLRIPLSGGLAGQMYRTRLSQVIAGKKYGGINGVEGVAFPLRKSEVSMLESLGLIVFVYEFSKVIAFSDRTLYNGNNLGLQTYSVVRVFDHTYKVMCDFVNRRAFENWDTANEKNQRKALIDYLDSIKGPKKDIESFEILTFEQDPKTKHIYLIFRIKPYFPGKTYIIKMDGMKVDDKVEWKCEYLEEE